MAAANAMKGDKEKCIAAGMVKGGAPGVAAAWVGLTWVGRMGRQCNHPASPNRPCDYLRFAARTV